MMPKNMQNLRRQFLIGLSVVLGLIILAAFMVSAPVAFALPLQDLEQAPLHDRQMMTPTLKVRSLVTQPPVARPADSFFVFLPLISRPPAPPLPPPARATFFVEPTIKTGSSSMLVDAQGGLHLAYANYLPPAEHPAAVYLYCAPSAPCGNASSWHGVALADRVNEVQLALTRDGQPRLLIRAKSQTAGLDWDYFYAECNQTCTNPLQWTGDWIVGSYGTSIFDINDDTSPQRSFALDSQDRPRFIYQDRNYPIEPDHIGAFYMACEADCADGLNWTETQISQTDGTPNYEVFDYPSLAFTASGQPRVAAMIDPLGSDTAFYYVACDSNCDDVNQWQRVKLFERDSGPNVSWDIEVDQNDRPRIAFYKGATLDNTGDQLYFVSCNTGDCLNAGAWQKLNLGLGSGVGKHPDLELTAQGQPRVAFIRKLGDGLGYTWCNAGCEATLASWHNTVVETATTLDQQYPVARPPHCNVGLWSSLAPVLSLDTGGHPRVAYDIVYNTQCWYDDPNDGLPPFLVWHQLWHSVRGVIFPHP
ncbi:hypothetical protein TFLX_00723 [Thermoflexales bacterium]|nr:hypothetical protein TFLX_00723 [Thermoflexales bacterium]